MAAALMNKTCPEFFQAESAGLEPGKLNPLVVTILQETGSTPQVTKRGACLMYGNPARYFNTS